MKNKLDTSFSQLQTTISALTTVVVISLNQKLMKAVDAAKVAGATDAQLQGFIELNTELIADTSKLAAANRRAKNNG